ncbi:MAG TPA: hypothetical protein VNC61_12235 [Acidimicrobiales bacterium]|nr:hypothetical protein [Acidimicrobiales bacterium]
MKPPGRLELGNAEGEKVSILSVGSKPATRQGPVLFALTYYGYHDPESKNIRLTALRDGFTPPGTLETIGGRRVASSSQFVPGYFGGNADPNAAWVERGVYMQVSAQGITEAQLAQFVAGLREHSPPPGS